jgi:hypothetical protein
MAAVMKIEEEPGDVAASTHETGAATSRRLTGEAKSLVDRIN